MFKQLYYTAISLILKPSEAWAKLSKNQPDDNEEFLSRYVYPFAGLITAVAFVGILFTKRDFDAQLALKASIRAAVSVFAGFWAASYLLNELLVKMFGREKNAKLCQRFVGYASSLMFAVQILMNLLPDFFFIRFFILYTAYIVWEGARPYMEIGENEQLKFSGFASAIIIFTPAVIEFTLYTMMPGLQF